MGRGLREKMDFGLVEGYVFTCCDFDADDHADEGKYWGAVVLVRSQHVEYISEG